MKSEQALSLLEVLIVITIFAVLGILVTQSVVLTLQGSRKSESIVHARENLDYSLNVIERQIRNAASIVSCPDPYTINYLDQHGYASSFSCQQMGSNNSYIASGSAHLTGNAVRIVNCTFTCTAATATNPALVQVDLTVKDASASALQSANVSASTQIYLRTY
ncbi:MAG: type II secretion system protein [Candidatus Woesebacteria bacterium]|nr:type II secretion system protein [Candidatus Woesebacteria bacterium]